VPDLSRQKEDPAYGPNGLYAFPKLPGVIHSNRMTVEMSYSRQPTSREFDAVQWREGRYRHIHGGIDNGDGPMLVAEFDIDNDGLKEIVIKAGFMRNYFPSESGKVAGGEDHLFVFEKDAIDLSKPTTSMSFYGGQDGKPKPAWISRSENARYRLIRPFVFEGVAYLSGYEQVWSKAFDPNDLQEYLDVVRYSKADTARLLDISSSEFERLYGGLHPTKPKARTPPPFMRVVK
jgi:hypothetical protein